MGHGSQFTPRMLLSRFPILPACLPCRAAGSPGVIPCCFPCVTVRSTSRDISITGGLILVLHSRPCSLAYTYRRAVSPFPSALCDRPACLLPASFNPSLGRISAFRYTSALFTCGWTNSLLAPFPYVMLDACLEFGTLAERTSKQPGMPGTQPTNAPYSSPRETQGSKR